MLTLYNLALLPLRLFLPLWAARPGRSPVGREEWRQRLARSLPDPAPGSVWIHGASAGEARIVAALCRALAGGPPLAVSAQTRAGRELLPAPPDVRAAFFAPLDLPGGAARLIARLRPRLLALVETELWPNLLHEAGAAGLNVAVVNARLSPERMRRYRLFAGLYRGTMARVGRVGAQSEEDAARFVQLGLPAGRVEVTGNIKYDLPLPPDDAAALRRRVGLDERDPLFLAGSTAEGEDALVLRAFLAARRERPDLRLALAPRHARRFDAAERLLREAGLAVRRYSRSGEAGGRTTDFDALLVDTVGDLGRLYRLARVAFVGGSLVPVGGHNLLEPAAVGVPVLFGPHVGHVAEIAAALESAGGARRVADADALARQLAVLLADEPVRSRMAAAAREVVAANRGALERSVALLRAALRPEGGPG